MAHMEDFNDFDNGWYDNDDLREMGDREAWEDSQSDLGDLHDLDDKDEDDRDRYYSGTGESMDDESYTRYLNSRY